ncbi:MAG: ABC transporter permease, partial [Oliverpabstia sp.]
IALMFAVNNLSYSERVRHLAEISSDMRTMFNMVTILSSLVTALVLSYATGFMLKLRRKEFGMYLTLGMTRRNIQTLFVCETALLAGIAMIVGMVGGIVLYQLIVALFSSIMEINFHISGYSVEGIMLTLLVGIGMFLLETLVSARYLKKISISELLKSDPVKKEERHFRFWCVLSLLTMSGMIGSFIITYQNLMAAFRDQDGVVLLLWLVVDLVMVFLAHFSVSRTIFGILLRNPKLKNRGTNAVILRGLSGRMTVNSVMIGLLATLLVFAIVMSNVALGEKIHSEYSINKDCPYDVIAMYNLSEEHEISMDEGRQIVERYSPVISQINYHLYSKEETTISSHILGYDIMGMTDKYLPLSQFNTLLEGCGYEPVTLKNEYLLISTVKGICDIDLSGQIVTLDGMDYTWAGSSTAYPDFIREWFCIVIPDRAVEDMPEADACAAYTLEDSRPEAEAMLKDLTYYQDTGDGTEEICDFKIQEYYRLYSNANAGTLIIGTLYVATVFICMALAILSMKTLSALEDERRQFAILYRLGTDVKMQKAALFRQTGAFFLMPFAFPLLMTVPLGMIFVKVYEIWDFAGLNRWRALETSALISLVVAGIYALYFFITYRIVCDYVVCYDAESSNGERLSR